MSKLASKPTERTVESAVELFVRESKTSPNSIVVGVSHPEHGERRAAIVSIRDNGDVRVLAAPGSGEAVSTRLAPEALDPDA